MFTLLSAHAVPRLATLLEGTLLRRSHPRRPIEVRAAAALAGLRLDALGEVRLAGVSRTLIVRAAAFDPVAGPYGRATCRRV